MNVKIENGILEQKEIDVYVERARELYGDDVIGIKIEVTDDEYVDIIYTLKNAVPFERIRRITGYLVGTLDKWNDAKRAEERDRVKHTVNTDFGNNA